MHPDVALVPNSGPSPKTASFPQSNQLSLQSKLDKWLRFVKKGCPASRSAFLAGIAASNCHRTAGLFTVFLENVARAPNPDLVPEIAIFPQSNQLNLQAKLDKWFRFVKNRCPASRTSFPTGPGRG